MKGNLSFCYPPRTAASDIGFISSMYLVYPHLSYLLKYNLCNNSGDMSVVRGHISNHMWYAHPNNSKIDLT
jgi:hypothetical protein